MATLITLRRNFSVLCNAKVHGGDALLGIEGLGDILRGLSLSGEFDSLKQSIEGHGGLDSLEQR